MKKHRLSIQCYLGMILWLVFASCMPAFAANTDLPINSLSMTVGQSHIQLINNMKAMIETRHNGMTRISIGVEDKKQDVEMLIQADVPSWDGIHPQYVQTQTDAIMFMLKHKKGAVFVVPAIRFAKDTGKQYIQRVRSPNNTVKFQKRSPDWTRMSKAKRLATGRGVIRNQGMEGSSFFVKIKPVVKNGTVKAIVGSFSGIASIGKNRYQKGNFVNIMDGQFNIEVNQHASIK
jgi:hypothetical protein